MRTKLGTGGRVAVVVAALVLVPAAASASVEISSAPTSNMNCSAGVCSPTAKKAVLNVTDLTNMLASGDVKVTTGNGALTITVESPFSWTSTSRLALDAYQDVSFRAPVTVAGTGAVTITYNDGGTGGDLRFFDGGSLSFQNLSDRLEINSFRYRLVGDVRTLARFAKKSRFIAFASNYDATPDGIYARSPILDFSGTLEGLGNTISNFSVNLSRHDSFGTALIARNSGNIRDLRLQDLSITATTSGGAVSQNYGTIANVYASGAIVGRPGGKDAFDYVGGLVAKNYGTIERSQAAVSVTANSGSNTYEIGGLVGLNDSQISTSSAVGSVSGQVDAMGGLVGRNEGPVELSFATGNVQGSASFAGGLVGGSFSESNCYSTGSVAAPQSVGGFAGAGNAYGMNYSYSIGHVSQGRLIGGFVAYDINETVHNSYWDLDTSGVTNRHRGAGDPPNDPGITGLTDSQLKSALPTGFDPNIWGHKKSINNGYPYLLANPPPQ